MSGYYCNNSDCKKGISPAVASFSIKKYRRYLCMACQKKEGVSAPPQARRMQGELPRPIPTRQAKSLYFALKDRGVILGRLEKWDGYKHIDIAVPNADMNLEVDGSHHGSDLTQAKSDLKRNLYSFKKGWITLHVPNCLVVHALDETAELIAEFIDYRVDELIRQRR